MTMRWLPLFLCFACAHPAPPTSALFRGCMVRAATARDLGNPADADPNSWKQAMAKVLSRYGAARVVVPGHGDPGGTELLLHTQELITLASPAP
jgi:metallo-beta-lactamase class B